MPYSIRKDGDKWKVVNSETGDVKGTHDSEADAKKQLAALYVHADDSDIEKLLEIAERLLEEPVLTKEMDSSAVQLFIPIQKVDLEKREIWGWGSIEKKDNVGETMDYPTSKPYFTAWSSGTLSRSGGKSLGNVREMHQPSAVGKLVDFRADDAQKGFFVGAKIVDDRAWSKVQEGVYTGFSVGGSYIKRWPDTDGVRFTAKPVELSLVDAPCLEDAKFQVVKGESTELRKFAPTHTGQDLVGIDLEKAEVPEAQGPTGNISLPAGEVKPYTPEAETATQIERMPDPFRTMALQASSQPTAATLAAYGDPAKELESAVKQLINQFPEQVKKTVQESVEKAIAGVFGTTSEVSMHRMIPVKPRRMIKVARGD